MKKVTLIIRKNQNNITESEIARIKRNIKKQFDEKVHFTTLANDAAEDVFDTYTGDVYVDGSYILIETSDVNYTFTAQTCELSSDLHNNANLRNFSVLWQS